MPNSASTLERPQSPAILSVYNMEERPLVSIILGVYNGEETLLKAVHSVLNQTYPYLELIVVDDASTDRTLELLATVNDPRLKIIRLAENEGVAHARNRAFTHAEGSYIAFIDADDIWFPQKLAADLETVRNAPDPVCVVYSWYYAIDEYDLLINLSPAYRDSGYILETIIQKENVLIPSTSLMHRQVFEMVGGFPATGYHEDWFFSVHAAKRFPIHPTGQRLVLYRQSLSGKARRRLRDYEMAVESYLSYVPDIEHVLSPAELIDVDKRRHRALLYSFLIYNFGDSAKRLYPEIDRQGLHVDAKGKLALFSMTTGINVLFLARVLYQFTTRYLMYPWWWWKVRWTRALIESPDESAAKRDGGS